MKGRKIFYLSLPTVEKKSEMKATQVLTYEGVKAEDDTCLFIFYCIQPHNNLIT